MDRPPFIRESVLTSDDDFLHVDFLRKKPKRIAILCHGLEGSSDSNYIRGTAGLLYEHGWDIAAMNYRGCSGVMNKRLRMYHSGATDDLETVIDYVSDQYEQLALVGFSLGGNLVLKYCGEREQSIYPKLVATVAISVPTDLHAGSLNIGRRSNFIYEKKFMTSLQEKIIAKHQQFPEDIDLTPLRRMRKLYDFDDHYTAPLHGFDNAVDYYTKCSSGKFLSGITLPTLIVNALDDPFLPEECYPCKAVTENRKLLLETPKNGGHVGFCSYGEQYYWDEWRILKFLNEKSG